MLDVLVYNFARWRLFRETTRKLRGLDDTTLADLGIRRSEIRALALRRTEEKLCRT